MNRIKTPCIIVHGGAFKIPESYIARYKVGTRQAAKSGYKVLENGGSAVDAVEAAVNSLENNSAFNAGHGSVLTEVNTVEMDAIIVDAATNKTGAVACVTSMSNPVSLARKVMDNTSHCILCADGALAFAKKIEFPLLTNPNELVTKDSLCKTYLNQEETFDGFVDQTINVLNQEDLKDALKQLSEENTFSESGHDTVGAVAMDISGNIACATSTGGIPGKMPGRVGDSPLLGCGAYGNAFGGCSSTGHGESLIRSTICREAIYYLEQGMSAKQSAQKAIDRMFDLTGGRGGIILIDREGNIAHASSTICMAWTSICSSEMKSGISRNEEVCESL